jgi:hypothetical protein
MKKMKTTGCIKLITITALTLLITLFGFNLAKTAIQNDRWQYDNLTCRLNSAHDEIARRYNLTCSAK